MRQVKPGNYARVEGWTTAPLSFEDHALSAFFSAILRDFGGSTLSQSSVISRTGQGSGLSPEEAAFQQLAASLIKLNYDPVLLCGWRSFGHWLEILSGLTLVAEGKAADGRGATEFVQMAKACGWVRFELQRETIMVRSAVAYTVEPMPVVLMLSHAMEPDGLLIYDAKQVQKGGRH